MKSFFLAVFILGLLHFGRGLISDPDEKTYNAGVVEFSPNLDQTITGAQRLADNLKRYIEILDSQKAFDLDIIVFPESSLNNWDTSTFIPDPEKNVIPCDLFEDDGPIKQISCAAKKGYKYIVINVSELAVCPDEQMIANNDTRPCVDGVSHYNTNVVFDRKGQVVSRYRKYNLYIEQVDRPKYPEATTFETDFGVTFGQFICFDLVFKRPALELVHEKKVRNIVYPTMWFGELPFATAIQLQQNWAYKNNINLLAAGANFPDRGSSGTGIYAGHNGVLVAAVEGNFKTELHVATIEKVARTLSNPLPKVVGKTPVEMQSLYLQSENMEVFETKLLDRSTGVFKEEICQNNLCCNFDIEFQFFDYGHASANYMYRAAVMNGKRSFHGISDGGIIACVLMACATNNIDSCSTRLPDSSRLDNTTTFTKVQVTGTFPYCSSYLLFPTSLDTSILPMQSYEFNYDESDTFGIEEKPFRNISMYLREPRHDLLSFGIHGRNFNLDDGYEEIDEDCVFKGGAISNMISLLVLAIGMLVVFNV